MGYWSDILVTFYIAKKFVTPFRLWKAYDLKIIDDKGKILKAKLTTREERDAFTMLDKAILKIRTVVGDSLFAKLGIVYLLSDYQQSGPILNEETIFDKAKKILGEGTITKVITSAGETARFVWETNQDGTVNFNIGWFYNDYMITNVGANFVHPNDAVNFLHSLRKGLVFEAHGIYNTLMHNELIEVNYGRYECRMKKVTNNNPSVTCDFFILLQSDAEKEYWLEGFGAFLTSLPKQATSPF